MGERRGGGSPSPPHTNTYTAAAKLMHIELATGSKEYRMQNIECRIQNIEYRMQKLMYNTLPTYLFFIWRLNLMIGPLEGLDPKNRDFFGT
jgi:hypothetical protein